MIVDAVVWLLTNKDKEQRNIAGIDKRDNYKTGGDAEVEKYIWKRNDARMKIDF